MNHVVYNLSDNKKKIVLMCRSLQGGGGAFRDQTTAVGAASVIHVAGRCCHQAQCKKKKTFERFQSMTRTVMLQQAAAAASDTEVDRR